jgi:NAD-dependent deacetylase
LPEAALERAVEVAAACDVLVTIGTSGLVYPAAEVPHVASRFGASVIQVNPQATALADVNLHGPAAEILPELISPGS